MLKKIQDEIKRLYASGMTQKQIAARAGIDQSSVSHLLHDPPEKLGRVAFETIMKLLPEMRVSFSGSPITIQNGDNNSINRDASGILRRVRRALMNAEGLCDKCKLAALSAIMSIETEEE